MVELIWDGKYDANGKRTAPPRLKLPFQTVETVNESAQQRQISFEALLSGQPTDWRNRLIWGDKKYVLPALLDEFAGQVDLIYIDPPFATGADFSYNVQIETESFIKEPSMLEQKAYRDTWGRGLDSYLQWIFETASLLRELLKENGSLYLHCEPAVSHYIKVILDEVFGTENFANELVWKRTGSHGGAKRYGPIHDIILFYSKSENFIWNPIYTEYDDDYKKRFSYTDPDGRQFQPISLIAAGTRKGSTGQPWRGIDVTGKGNHWRYTIEKLEELDSQARIYWPDEGGYPRLKHYLDESKGSPIQDLWLDISALNSQAKEREGYPTQKPEALLERIIQASSNPDDLVLDCFCLRAGSLVRVVEAPPTPPDFGGESKKSPDFGRKPEKSPRERGDLGGPTRERGEIGGLTRERGEIGGPTHLPIEHIRPGQTVIGHDGQPHRVLHTHHRTYTGPMIGLQHAASPHTLWLTADHRVLCQKRPIILKSPPSSPRAGETEEGRKKSWSHVSPEMFARSQELRRNSTPAEQKLWQALRGKQLGVSFRRQHPLGPYIADFYSRQAGLVIEVDGDSHTTPQAQAHDAQRAAWIEQAGLRVMRFWNNQVMNNLSGVLQTIQTCLQETTVPHHPDKEWRRAEDLREGDIVFYGDSLEPVEINRLRVEETTETVYDLTVADTHSFLTAVCLVHNCGSGTTAAVAEKLGRRWITCDLGRFAIHTTRKRLLSIDNVRPFVVQNLGKYERQAWQAAEFPPPSSPPSTGGTEGGPSPPLGGKVGGQAAPLGRKVGGQAAQVVAAYRRFILDLYHARPITGYAWLHGLKQGRMVHVGAVDSPISPADVKQIAIEFHKATGTGADAPSESAVDVLGWDFAFELNEVARQQAAEANITMRFVRIPREVLEKRAVEQGDIKFFELAALAVEVAQEGRGVNLTLTDFVIPPDDVPAEVQAAITHWSQWIDYWAVDWDNKGDTFHNMWQTYRTRQDKSLGLRAGHKYEQPGQYVIMVKVIDILGNDTTKTLKVEVK